MRPGFLMERTYMLTPVVRQCFCPPELRRAELTPQLHGALQGATWQAREPHLVPAFELLAGMHNRLGLTPPL
jgi:hypothetical protein